MMPLPAGLCILKQLVLAAKPETESQEFDLKKKDDQKDRETGFQATLRSYFRECQGFKGSNGS